MSAPKPLNTSTIAVRSVQNVQTTAYESDDNKVRRTLASFCGLAVNTYIMWIFKATEGVSSESQLFFHLLALVMLVVTIRERDASYLFTAFAVFFVPYIVLAAGLSIYSLAAIAAGITVLGFQRGVTVQGLASGAANIAESLGQSNTRRRILRLSQSDIDPALLVEEDLQEFAEIEGELVKVRKTFESAKPAMKSALNQTISQVEQLQSDHARVLARSAGLSAFLNGIDRRKLNGEIEKFEQQLGTSGDEVFKAQLQATIDMKKQRISELDRLETCLNRVKMQKIQMREMFNSLMDRMNTLKFTDIMTLQASSDDMVKEVKSIRSGLEDLEKGLLEAEKISRS